MVEAGAKRSLFQGQVDALEGETQVISESWVVSLRSIQGFGTGLRSWVDAVVSTKDENESKKALHTI